MRAYNHNRIVAPTVEPITVQQIRDFLNITHSEDDTMLGYFITAAREACELFTGRSLNTQTWTAYYTEFPYYSDMELRKGPVQSVIEIRFFDIDSEVSTVDDSTYYLSESNLLGMVSTNNNETWPTDILRYSAGVEIDYVTGFGDEAEDVPMQLRLGMIQYAANLYKERNEDALTTGVKQKWSQFKRIELT